MIAGGWLYNALSYHPSAKVHACYDAWITGARDAAKAIGYSEDRMIQMFLFSPEHERCDQLKAQDEDAWRTGKPRP
jgi:hypothetical protein